MLSEAFMNFYKPFMELSWTFIKLLNKLFYKAFYKAFRIKPFQMHSLAPVSISVEIPLTSKKRRQAKFCLVDACS